ncbi:NADPH:quinone oxidoreductase family protein [Cognatishimia sp. SS12]|uniref:NADPH:quinone oxidoreductase family protein n=1 Tax=Cognatishimia sp. SS12 TaxID=2979465 RepID=UPI00232DD555|nr:NADPH:quinone oxidoreductase family protein [Cognatishimia sp. SS12]MDC0738619.1 NADPH:quinone oxidoreductase family protein [Cognatishimia sp. SS12]
MRAYQISSFDTPAQVVDLPVPSPKRGEIQLKIRACGLNFADLLMQKGTYQDTPDLPFVGGMEVAGVVSALGPETDGPEIGSRVAVFGGQGGLADYGCFPAERAISLPESMPFEDAAAFLIAYGTSHVALDYRARLQPGETLLVLGAAGGVGLTAVEIGKLMGARVIACARGQDKLDVAARAGADHLIDAQTDDLRGAIKALGGADVVYDPVGGEQWKAAFRAANPDARLLPIGFASGEVPKIPANHMLVKNLSVLGVYWGGYLQFKPRIITDSLTQLFSWYSEGRLKPHVSHVLPLEEAAKGLDLLRRRASTGKVVIKI